MLNAAPLNMVSIKLHWPQSRAWRRGHRRYLSRCRAPGRVAGLAQRLLTQSLHECMNSAIYPHLNLAMDCAMECDVDNCMECNMNCDTQCDMDRAGEWLRGLRGGVARPEKAGRDGRDTAQARGSLRGAACRATCAVRVKPHENCHLGRQLGCLGRQLGRLGRQLGRL